MPSENQDSLPARIVISVALVLLLTGAGLGIFFKMKSQKKDPEKVGQQKPRIAVRVMTAKREAYPEMIRGYGTTRALRSSTISAEVAGVVLDLDGSLEAGNPVGTKTVLVTLDKRDYENARTTAEARQEQAGATVDRLTQDLKNLDKQLEIAQKDFESAQRELVRVTGLEKTGVVNKSELERQESATNAAEKEVLRLEAQRDSTTQELTRAGAEVKLADAAFDRAELDIGKTEIRAPFPGKVGVRLAEKGARVAPGTPLFTLVDPRRVEIAVAIGASHFGEVVKGATASVWLGNGKTPAWTGKVARISPTMNSADRTFLAYLLVEVEKGEAPVPPGDFVRAEVGGRVHRDVIAVPRAAFVEDQIYVATPVGGGEVKIEIRDPKVLRFLPEVALVSTGLEPGELVVVTNLEQVADGARVMVVDDTTAKGVKPPEDDRR